MGFEGFDWTLVLAMVASSLLAAALALAILATTQVRRRRRHLGLFNDSGGGTVFLFDRHDLIDATAAARALLSAGRGANAPWQRLLAFLAPRFPDFESRLEQIESLGRFSLQSTGRRALNLRAEWHGGLTRISLSDSHSDPTPPGLDIISQRALDDEVETLRDITEHAPLLIWREGAGGAVIWANRAYLMLARARLCGDDGLCWPLPRLFPAPEFPAPEGTGDGSGPSPWRAHLEGCDDEAPRSYDCYSFDTGADTLVYALPADTAVQAENSLRSFIQTLTKTFAHLTIGLAIFDRQRRLALFNPALIDLTALSPEFLSARPALNALLDAMRERQMIPEPKDYKSWRAQMAALEKAAATGQYEETWSLPSGQTYRVVGRPHPDGAVAFLFEDISAEMTVTRRFRAELELNQGVIDSLDEAIAVFSPSGMMILSNAAHAALWGTGGGATLAETGITQATMLWQTRCAPSPVWGRLRDFVGTVGERAGWAADLRLGDGRALVCRVQPIAGGATLIGFTPARAMVDEAGGTPVATTARTA